MMTGIELGSMQNFFFFYHENMYIYNIYNDMPSHTLRLFQKLSLGMIAVTTQICVTKTYSVIHLLRRAVSIICIYSL